MGSDDVVPMRQPAGAWVRWTKALKTEFLDHLAGTCNITAAAAAVGVPAASVQRLRRTNVRFARAWEQALDDGYVLLETRLVGHVLSGATRTDRIESAGGETEAIDVEQALRVLKEREVRRAGVRSRKAGGADRLTRATAAQTDAAILRKLRAVAASTGEA